MGKRKRPTNQAPTQDEIWDDSALIRSWDEAVAEYEFYHSIAARGEDVEEVLRLAELDEENEASTNDVKGIKTASDAGRVATKGNSDALDEGLEDGEVDEDGDLHLASEGDPGGPVSKNGSAEALLLSTKSTAAGREGVKGKASTTTAGGKHSILENTDATGHGPDQVLENVKMAYWWAGYYSGLYEGQQQAKAASTR